MRLAVSNIAWPADADDAVAAALAEVGVEGIEIAPTKVWPNPLEASAATLDAYRRAWESRGLPIVAAQALLFGRPELTLFDDAATRSRTLEYLRGIVRVCGRLGAKALVFGSPKNRRAVGRDVSAEAVDFFGRLGEAALDEGTAVVMEANPPEYGADWVTRAAEALALVRAVAHPGFRLHLDAACLTMAGDDLGVIAAAGETLTHFHASEPNLAPLGAGVDHARFATALRDAGYGGWVSVEMRQPDPFDAHSLTSAVGRAVAWYGREIVRPPLRETPRG